MTLLQLLLSHSFHHDACRLDSIRVVIRVDCILSVCNIQSNRLQRIILSAIILKVIYRNHGMTLLTILRSDFQNHDTRRIFIFSWSIIDIIYDFVIVVSVIIVVSKSSWNLSQGISLYIYIVLLTWDGSCTTFNCVRKAKCSWTDEFTKKEQN